jgi:hypothetical protein
MISEARRALAEGAMWSVVGAGSMRHDSEELATSLVRYQGGSNGSAEVRTGRAGSSLSAGAIWDQIISWCREHDVTQPRWSVVRSSEPRAFAELIRALGGVFADSTVVLVADIDAALALPAAATAMRAEVVETRDQLSAADAVTGHSGTSAETEARVRTLAISIATRAASGYWHATRRALPCRSANARSRAGSPACRALTRWEPTGAEARTRPSCGSAWRPRATRAGRELRADPGAQRLHP